ncbi:GldG family protein [Imhoffiella purpurea]|uniref:ABC-type uncharacterized transport system domain-containing protein n=1 Tax=Imhoffiella purpurea TaxID=1249627 RepID=W9VCH4_9GAMM|nr:GldG family protein [Imhoffiella purpurea]EXJ17149.1 hypothetical protein D779_0901 [Imhoffiella purpurea]
MKPFPQQEFPQRLWIRLQRVERALADLTFVLLLLALVIGSGWLIARHDRYWDWTSSGSNSLTAESLAILDRLDAPLRITVFSPEDTPLGEAIERLLAPYRQNLPEMQVDYLDPQLFPERARDADVTLIGQILLEYQGRRETLKEVGERSISAAIARLAETRSPWVAVIEGHGERSIQGGGTTDLGRLGQELRDQGFLARPLDLATIQEVPHNTRLLVLSMPQIQLFPGEIESLLRYLDRGGNLLWLMDPGPMHGLDPLAAQLGLSILPGVIVDAAAAKMGVETPAVAVISDYPTDPLTEGLSAPALLPGSLGFETRIAPGWDLATYLSTGSQSWNETGRLEGKIVRDEVVGEQAGPLAVVLALTRNLPDSDRQQRVLVVGDSDFLSNAQIGSHGNRELGLRFFRWLSGEEPPLALPPPPQAAEALELSSTQRMLIGVGVLLLLPGLFVTSGFAIRWYRWRGR